MLKDKVHNHFYIGYDKSKVADGVKQAYLQGADDCLKYLQNDAWHMITDCEDSYPPVFEYVLVEDDCGDKNVAYCDPDYGWYISDGENSLKLIGNVIKWIELN